MTKTQVIVTNQRSPLLTLIKCLDRLNFGRNWCAYIKSACMSDLVNKEHGNTWDQTQDTLVRGQCANLWVRQKVQQYNQLSGSSLPVKVVQQCPSPYKQLLYCHLDWMHSTGCNPALYQSHTLAQSPLKHVYTNLVKKIFTCITDPRKNALPP